MKRYLVELEAGEGEALAAITRKGSHRSQTVVHALVLLNCDESLVSRCTSVLRSCLRP